MKIERIQNPSLFQKYQTYKTSIINRIGNNKVNVETYPVFHGTSESSVESIYKGNFDRNYAGKNGQYIHQISDYRQFEK